MACDDGCNCLVQAGTGVKVTGSGSARDPYVVEIDSDFSGNLQVRDTETVNLTLMGNGTPTDPYEIEANATVRLTQLADVSDPQGGPNAGDVPVWVTTGSEAHWEFQPPPPNPAGSVNTGAGIAGDGTLGAPLAVAVIGTTAGGATSGLEVYVDSAGNLRAVPPVATAVAWDTITGRPAYFPADVTNSTGILPVARGGTGATSLSAITVGTASNALKVAGHDIFVQSGTPTGTLNDLWFW